MSRFLDVWDAFRGSPLFGLALTLLAYEGALALQRKMNGSVLLNPVLVATALIIALLSATGASYSDYIVGANLIFVLLGPAAVALAVPLFAYATEFRRTGLRLVLASGIGAAVACAAAVAIAAGLGASDLVVRSIAPKSVTLAIAIGVSEQIGAELALTAVLVIATGMLGAIISGWVLDIARVRQARLRGLAIGVAGHGIGTAHALTVDAETGAFAGLGMTLAGLLTGLVLPVLWSPMWAWFTVQ